jgi:flagellar basal body P-ring formation protein FlgA
MMTRRMTTGAGQPGRVSAATSSAMLGSAPLTGLAAALCLTLAAPPVFAEALEATRTLRAGQVIGPDDVTTGTRAALPGLVTDAAEAVGMEARVTLYPGRAIPLASLSPPALVERNQLVTLIFRQGGLEIRAEGRALGRGAADEAVRVMNLASRSTVSGRVSGPATVSVP